MQMEIKELYATLAGSHAWGMDQPTSDYDYWIIYQSPSRSFLLGNTHKRGHGSKGKFSDGDTWDRISFEIGQHIRELMGGNINHVVGLLGPSVYPHGGEEPSPMNKIAFFDSHSRFNIKDHQSDSFSNVAGVISPHPQVKLELRKLFLSNSSKNIFNSINGMSGHNINSFFVKEHRSGKINPQFIPDTKENEPIRIKKLGQIRRIIEFGFRVLVDGVYDLKPVEINNGSDGELSIVRQWREDLLHAYNTSDLPENSDKKPYEDYLIDLRMSMLDR